MSKTLTLAEVAAHDREEDCYLIIGNERTGGAKVYDVTKYLDEHPGGDAVLLELAGKYADDMFEDIGHSTEARKVMAQFLKGPLKATDEELEKLGVGGRAAGDGGGGGMIVPIIVVLLAVAAYFVYQQQQKA